MLIKDVPILVQTLVELRQHAKPLIIIQYVHVRMGILVIHLLDVLEFVSLQKSQTKHEIDCPLLSFSNTTRTRAG